MEDNLQRVFSILLSVLILFILPLYITFEKKDDISYSLALRITNNFVENVSSKGYISREMYDKYINELATSGNMYDIRMEHISKKYTPALYIYNDENKTDKPIKKLDYLMYKDEYYNNQDFIQVGAAHYPKKNIDLSYDTSEVKYNERQIIETMSRKNSKPYSTLTIEDYEKIDYSSIPYITDMYANYKLTSDAYGKAVLQIDETNNIYTMNKGDEFNIRIKNKNVTIATVLFNAFTMGIGGNNNNVRVYINYGGTIENEEYKNLGELTT